MPGEFVSPGGAVGMGIAQPGGYPPPPPMSPHPAQLRHGPSLHSFIPGHAHHAALMMHHRTPPHPALQPPPPPTAAILNPGEPIDSGHAMDVHAH